MRQLIAPVALFLAMLLSTAAHAETDVTVEWLGEQNPVAGSQYTYSLNYTISGDGVNNVGFSVTLPPNVAVMGISLPQSSGVPTFGPGSGCTKTSAGTGSPAFDPWLFECLLTATSITPSEGSISGTVTLVLHYRRYAFNDGTDLNFSATFASDEDTATDTHLVTVEADAALAIWTSDVAAFFSVGSGEYDPDGGGALPPMNGNFYRFPVRIYNGGTAPLAPGTIAEVPLGEHTWLVSVDVGVATSGWSVDSLGSTAAIGAEGGTLYLDYDLPLGSSGPLTNINSYSLFQHSARAWVSVFIPCAYLGPNLNSSSDPDDAPFSYLVEGTEDKVPVGPGPEDSLLSHSTVVPTNGVITSYFFADCGTPGPAGKSSSPELDAPIGENMTWVISAYPASGQSLWDRALMVDPIPAEVDFVNAVVVTSSTNDLSTSFELFLCRIPAMAQTTFNLAAFDAYLLSNECRSRNEFFNGNTPLGSTPWPLDETTHVAAHAEPWADPLSPDEPDILVMHRLRVNIVTWIDVTTPDDTVITNVAQIYGVVDGGPVGIGPLTDTVTAQGEANPIVRAFPIDPATNTLDTVYSPGDPIDFGFSFNRNNGIVLFRPVIRIDFPPGVQINSAAFVDVSNACPDLPGANGAPQITGPTLDDGGTPGDPLDDHDYIIVDALLGAPDAGLYTAGCSNATSWDWVRNAFRAYGTVIATYPHVSSEPLTVRAHLSVENVSNIDVTSDGLPANERTFAYNFNVITSAEMRVRVEAGCAPTLGPAYVTYDYSMENTAGTHLTDVGLVMTVPKVGVPAGNTVDTTFVSVTAPGAGESVDYSTDGVSFSATPPANLADVTHVRYHKNQLDAYDTRAVRMIASHATNVPLGTNFLTTATLDSAELSPVGNSSYDAWTTGDCPSQLVVFKYFDATAPLGSYDAPGDQPLSNWAFTTDGPTVDTATTAANGEVTFLVLPGAYTVTESLPTPGTITWSATTTGGTTQNVAVGLDPTYRLEFGNNCSCNDDNSCTADSCVYPGVCDFEPTPGVLCDPANLCNECDAAGDCVPKALACDDPDTCQQPGQCDPQTGACTFLPITCEPLPVYVIVNGPDGQPAGTVRCIVAADQSVTCDMDGPFVAIDPTLWCPGE